METQHNHEHTAFFASRMNLPFREDVYKLGGMMKQAIWVAPYSAPELKGKFDEETQILCLKKVREARNFICVLDGSYGTPWTQTELSILELELITAVLARKPIYIFLLEPFDEDPRLSSLLRVVELSYPEAKREVVKSEKKIKDEIQRLIEGDRKNSFWERAPGYFLQYLAELRTILFNREKHDLDVRFLNGEFAPITRTVVEKEFISHLIENADATPSMSYKLANLWAAFRHLSAFPYTSSTSKEFMSLWGEVLSKWASAASWYGLHGHPFLGRLAATNTLLDLKKNNPSVSDAASLIKVSRGDLASEYFSIGRMAKSWRYKRALYNKALSNVDNALAEQHSDPYILRSIRANILLSLGHVYAAVKDSELALQLLKEANEDLGRIGEAETDLGFAYFFIGRKKKAQSFLENGIEKLRNSDRVTFTAKAMKKLILFYGLTLQRRHAQAAYNEAYKYAQEHEINDQLQQLETLARWLLLKRKQ